MSKIATSIVFQAGKKEEGMYAKGGAQGTHGLKLK